MLLVCSLHLDSFTRLFALTAAISIRQGRRRRRQRGKRVQRRYLNGNRGQESGVSRRSERILCTVSPVSSFHGEERGRPTVDLGHTKGALILSREPNQSTETWVQKETSLSSTAIEPPEYTPQIKPGGNQRPECGKCLWSWAQCKVQVDRKEKLAVGKQ